MILSHCEKFAVFAGKLPAISKLPFELPAKNVPAKSPCLLTVRSVPRMINKFGGKMYQKKHKHVDYDIILH